MSRGSKARRFYHRRKEQPASRGLIWGAVAVVVLIAAIAAVVMLRKRARK